MTDYVSALSEAAARNGRECAEAAVELHPERWTAPLVDQILDHLADALVQTFPGGSAQFRAFADVVIPAARMGFHARRIELGKILPGERVTH